MQTPPGVLRAVYYEDDPEQFDEFKEALRNILQFKAEAAEIIHAATDTELATLLKTRPHVVFCDNDHVGKRPTEGAIAISKHKPKHPDTVFCLLTKRSVNTQSFGSFMPNPDVVMSKTNLGSKNYVKYLGGKLRKLIRRSPLPITSPPINLKEDGPSHSTKGVSLSREELHSILEQVIDSEGVPVLSNEFQSAELAPLKGGFSGAGVYTLTVTRASGQPNVPAVLKISQRDKAVREHENFLQFVKWRLPYLWRVDVLGTGHTGDFGAICYSFASGGGEAPLPVNSFLRRGDENVIERVLNSVLHSKNQTWYSEQRPSGMDIREYFSQDRFYRTSSKREVLEDYFYDYLVTNLELSKVDVIANDRYVHFEGVKYPKIDQLVFANRWGQVTECVCHGDLNGNNLLFAGGASPVVFIDFQDTGFWHVFRDFVSFEASVRIEHPAERLEGETDEALFLRYLALERHLAEASWDEIGPEFSYARHASRIRHTAHRNFEDEPLALYLVANIIHTIWMFERAQKWAVHKRLRMAATILESTLALERLRERSRAP